VVKGNAEKVLLLSGSATFSPGDELPPGGYEVRAWFDGAPVEAGSIQVRVGQTTTVSCSASFLRCR